MEFLVIDNYGRKHPSSKNKAYLSKDNWNDFSFTTMFHLTIFDKTGTEHEIGNVKIAFKGQTIQKSTYNAIDKTFSSLNENYFSLGTDVEYYKNINKLPTELKEHILNALNDIVYKPEKLEEIEDEDVLNTSLLRWITLSDLHGQFNRAIHGLAELSDFQFNFIRQEMNGFCNLQIPFKVKASSTPSTNIHALIGRNGCGKTTILNNMIDAITNPKHTSCFFTEINSTNESRIPAGYFRSLISVSFSAFDPFTPPQEQPDPTKGTKYFYIGLKSRENKKQLNSLEDLQKEFISALIDCLSNETKKNLWLDAISNLNSDPNFESMDLNNLNKTYIKTKNKNKEIQTDNTKFKDSFHQNIIKKLNCMSSGHAIVLFTITRIINTVGEKSLVLLDEPEVHLHPPLLSAFLRTLSNLLHIKNGVAIIATHSPVVLQEIPKSCVWKVIRSREEIATRRPEIETFGENLGVLTREIFILEVENSGYHSLLKKSVESGNSYDEILLQYNNQIGLEGRTILKAMTLSRDSKKHDEKTIPTKNNLQ